MIDSFDDIFENDPDGLLNVKPKASAQTGDERVRGKFDQVQEFFREKGRAPEPNQFDISEFQLYAQLKGIRENDELRMAMEPLDQYGLLGEQKAAPESIEDIFSDDEFGELLGGGDDEPNLFEFKHTPKDLERAEADFVAQRKPVKDFSEYEPMFKNVQRELREEKRKIIPFKQQDLQPGNYFIHNGLLLYLESVDTLAEKKEFSSGSRKREDGRTLTIFENGTKSNLLYRSLYKGLLMNGKTVTQTEQDAHSLFQENFGGVGEDDKADGLIYICQSLSDDPQIAQRDNLYKVGYTRGSMDWRLHKAHESPTYLMAEVKVIEVFECFNLNTQKFEALIHRFFDAARLRIDVFDEEGVRHEPREWFEVPLPQIEKAIQLLISGEIVRYRFDLNSQQVVAK
jgi:hypothetical protein